MVEVLDRFDACCQAIGADDGIGKQVDRSRK